MERTIKFRGKRTDNGEWVYGDLFQLDTQLCIAGVHQWATAVCNNSLELGVDVVIPESIGQFPGLKDKNGIDIYEGDVINHYCNGYEIVSYGIQSVDAFEGIGFNLWNFYGEYNDLGKGIRLQSSIEAIGDIHDNPELIQ